MTTYDPESKVFSYTKMVRASDNRYPVYLSLFKQENPNVSIGDFVWEYAMAEFGYYKVHETTPPEGDVHTEGFPILAQDGLWYETWTTRAYTQEEKEEILLSTKSTNKEDSLRVFGMDLLKGILVDGDYYRVRDEDITTMLVDISYANSHPDEKVYITRADDYVVSLSATEGIDRMNTIVEERGRIQRKLQSHLYAVYSATTATDIPPVPKTFLGA